MLDLIAEALNLMVHFIMHFVILAIILLIIAFIFLVAIRNKRDVEAASLIPHTSVELCGSVSTSYII